MARHHLLAFTNPVPGREDEFNRWYDEHHLTDMLAMPGFLWGQRFRVADATGQGKADWQYLAMYEFESDDPDGLMADVRERIAAGKIPRSDALAGFMGVLAEPIGPRVPAKKG